MSGNYADAFRLKKCSQIEITALIPLNMLKRYNQKPPDIVEATFLLSNGNNTNTC